MYIKVETVVELGFEITTLRFQVLCSTAGPHHPQIQQDLQPYIPVPGGDILEGGP